MTIRDDDIRRQLQLGEDSRWEFKQIEFNGDTPTSPRRDDFADELGAFANADGGVMLCGVADDGTIQGMSREQMAALDHLLVEVSTHSVEPPLRIEVHHRELDGKAFVLVGVPRGEALHERSGRAFVRVGATKRRLRRDEDRFARAASERHDHRRHGRQSGNPQRGDCFRFRPHSRGQCGGIGPSQVSDGTPWRWRVDHP